MLHFPTIDWISHSSRLLNFLRRSWNSFCFSTNAWVVLNPWGNSIARDKCSAASMTDLMSPFASQLNLTFDHTCQVQLKPLSHLHSYCSHLKCPTSSVISSWIEPHLSISSCQSAPTDRIARFWPVLDNPESLSTNRWARTLIFAQCVPWHMNLSGPQRWNTYYE